MIDRRRLQQIQLVQGPNRILLTLEDLTFINPQLSKKVNTISVDNHVKHTSTHAHTNTHSNLISKSFVAFDFPQKITLEDLTESKSGLEDKSADLSHSVNSMQTATHETTSVAVFEVGAAVSLPFYEPSVSLLFSSTLLPILFSLLIGGIMLTYLSVWTNVNYHTKHDEFPYPAEMSSTLLLLLHVIFSRATGCG